MSFKPHSNNLSWKPAGAMNRQTKPILIHPLYIST